MDYIIKYPPILEWFSDISWNTNMESKSTGILKFYPLWGTTS